MRLSITSVFLLLNCAVFAQRSAHQLNYRVDISDPSKGFADIELDYKGPTNDSVTFTLPSNWGDDHKLSYFRLSEISPDHSCRYNADSTKITCLLNGKKSVSLHYRILNGIPDSISADGEMYLLQLKPNYFSAFSNGLLMAVDDSIHPNSYCSIVFSLPAGWETVWSNFGKAKRSLAKGTIGPKVAINTMQVSNTTVQNMIFHAGDYRIYQTKTATGQGLTFCIRGKWSFGDKELMDEVAVVLDQQRKFWDDYSAPLFFVSLNPMISPDERSMSYTGTGLANAFAMSAYCNKNVTPAGLRYLLNHELMHHWIGGIIENAKDEELSYWFSEGFTDYFARLNMLEGRQVTQHEYNKMIDSVFRAHYSSQYVAYPNDSIKVHFWDNRGIEKLPYNRGSLFALYLDHLLRKQTGGAVDLKRVMRSMLTDLLNRTGEKYTHRPFQTDWLIRKVKELSGLEIGPLINTHIFQGVPISVEQFNEVLSPKLKMADTRVFDMGFDTQETAGEKGSVVINVKYNSGAEAAGIKAGDRIMGYDLLMNPDIEGQLLVKRNGEEAWVKFYPYMTVSVPQLEKE